MKIIVKYINYGLNIFILIMLLAAVSTPLIIDKVVLIEERFPDYWNYFRDVRGELGEVFSSTDERRYLRNKIVNSIGTVTGEGYVLACNENGAITFEGKNNGEDVQYVFCILDKLPAGYCIYDDGIDIEGINSYVEGINYTINDGEERVKLGERIDPTFSRYQFKIDISKGFEGQVVLKPMLRLSSDTNETYEPCLTKNIEVSDSIKYYLIHVTPWDLSELTIADFRHMTRSITRVYPEVGWVTFCIGDDCGIQIVPDDKKSLLYGTIDPIGRLSNAKTYNSIDDIIAAQQQKKLQDISCFVSYLKKLHMENRTFFISIKDEGTRNLKYAEFDALNRIGCQTDFSNKYRYSYLAVFENGKNVYEEISKDQLRKDGCLSDGTSYSLTSAGYDSGNTSSIMINGQECSMNRRGMNIVVVEDGKVIDTVAFDTNFDMFAYRDNSFLVDQ